MIADLSGLTQIVATKEGSGCMATQEHSPRKQEVQIMPLFFIVTFCILKSMSLSGYPLIKVHTFFATSQTARMYLLKQMAQLGFFS